MWEVRGQKAPAFTKATARQGGQKTRTEDSRQPRLEAPAFAKATARQGGRRVDFGLEIEEFRDCGRQREIQPFDKTCRWDLSTSSSRVAQDREDMGITT